MEDSLELRVCVAEYLRLGGLCVVEADSATQAVAAIVSGVHFDLVFSDVDMPGAMDGAGLAQWLSLNYPLLPIVLTSGQSRPKLASTVLHTGFVQKPYMLDDLELDIRERVAASYFK